MLRRTDDPHRFDANDARDKLAALVGMVAQAERHVAAPDEIADLLTRSSPQIKLDRGRAWGELAQHLNDIGVRQGADQGQRHYPPRLADRRLHGLTAVLDRR